MRLVVARCEVSYSGRLNAYLPDSTRLLIVKADGSVLVHADAGGYKPPRARRAAGLGRPPGRRQVAVLGPASARTSAGGFWQWRR